MQPIGAGNNQRPLALRRRCEIRKSRRAAVRTRSSKQFAGAGNSTPSKRSQKKFTSRPKFHGKSLLSMRTAIYNTWPPLAERRVWSVCECVPKRFERRPPFLARNGGDGLRGEFAFPPRDHHARNAIPKNSDRSSSHVHKLIDREE